MTDIQDQLVSTPIPNQTVVNKAARGQGVSSDQAHSLRQVHIEPIDRAGHGQQSSGRGETVGADSIFIAPRVIDCESYNDFAGALKALIGQAQQVMSELGESIQHSRDANETTRTQSSQYQERLQLGRRLLTAVERGIEQNKTITEKITARRHSLEELEERAAVQIDVFRERLVDQSREVQQESVEECRQRTEKLTEMSKAVAALDVRLHQIDRIITERIDNTNRELDRRLDPVVETMDGLCRQAHAILGYEPYASVDCVDSGDEADKVTPKPAKGSLGDMVGRADQCREGVAHSERQAKSLREQLDVLFREMSTELLTGVEVVDLMADKRDQAEQMLSRIEESLGQVDARIESKIVTADSVIDQRITEMKSQGAEIGVEIERMSANLNTRVEKIQNQIDEASKHSEETVSQAEELRRELDEMIQIQGESSSRLQHLLDRLVPWESLIAGASDEPLPEPLRSGVAAIQESVRRELSELGRQLLNVAERASPDGCRVNHDQDETVERSDADSISGRILDAPEVITTISGQKSKHG